MKRHSRVLGDPGGRSFSAYGSSIPVEDLFGVWWRHDDRLRYTIPEVVSSGTCQWHPSPRFNTFTFLLHIDSERCEEQSIRPTTSKLTAEI
jgi:hypothetical protein